MKCKECNCCKLGWYKSAPNKYVCVGVKHPFIIENINKPCTEYKDLMEKRVTNFEHIKNMNAKDMAKFLMSNWFTDGVCNYCEGLYDKCEDFDYCEAEILKYLLKSR